ncbi:hypothetical protein EVAR_52056_1 [Eumeta japonica]|uniref:Uncharacterized protein n=1 Tax=Eumeta variegata TaxID=151549 RepID=A0A4C1Z9H1_EUMVA|nr:hypothetical protein EVAR_52056_1 [Eumeta japonica]
MQRLVCGNARGRLRHGLGGSRSLEFLRAAGRVFMNSLFETVVAGSSPKRRAHLKLVKQKPHLWDYGKRARGGRLAESKLVWLRAIAPPAPAGARRS